MLQLTASEQATVDAIAKAKKDIAALSAPEAATEISTQNYTQATESYPLGGYIFLSRNKSAATGDAKWNEFYAKDVVVVDDTKHIFDANGSVVDIKLNYDESGNITGPVTGNVGNKELKLNSPLVTDTSATATVKVTYAHNVYTDVTREVTYKVTLKASNGGDAADKIVFEAQ